MRKHRICILLNKLEEYDFDDLIKRYLPLEKFDVKIVDIFPDNSSYYDLIIPWNYRKVLKNVNNCKNIIIFHSSDLPEGKGWAPLYYSFREELANYTISCIFAHEKVDEGNIILKASFPILPEYTATFLRKVDSELSCLLIKRILDKWPKGNISSVAQKADGNFRTRRFPHDNKINTNHSIKQLLPHLRGVEKYSPAFFVHEGIEFVIEVYPKHQPDFPKKIKICYAGERKHEFWTRKNN